MLLHVLPLVNEHSPTSSPWRALRDHRRPRIPTSSRDRTTHRRKFRRKTVNMDSCVSCCSVLIIIIVITEESSVIIVCNEYVECQRDSQLALVGVGFDPHFCHLY